MLSSTLWRAFTSPLTYLLLFILLGTAIMQIRYVNKALQRFDSTQVIPIQFVMFTLCVIIGSAVLYRDFEKTTPERATKFVGGCLLTFFGVFLITSGRQHKDEDDDLLEDADGIDETIGLIDQDGNPAMVPEGEYDTDTISRRSSKVSRLNCAELFKTGPQQEHESGDGATIRPAILIGTPPGHGLGSIDELGIESPPRGIRTLSSNSVVSAPTSSISDGPPGVVLALREPQGAQSQAAERPVTPRAPATISKGAARDRDRTFYSPSPLYSTVTTVVKDALRENVGLNSQSSLRRIRSSIRASLFIESDEEDQAANENDTQPTIAVSHGNDLLRVLTGPETASESANESGRRRARSLSETVGSFFRPKKKAKNIDLERTPDIPNNDNSNI